MRFPTTLRRLAPWRHATLIQDILELRCVLDPVLHDIAQKKMWWVDPQHILVWIITEEVRRNYNIATERHNSELFPMPEIHHDLKSRLHIPLDLLITHYVKAPAVYGDEGIDSVNIKDYRDLYIHYKTNKPFAMPF